MILFQSVPTRMPGPARSHVPWGQPVPTAQAMAWNVCGAAAPSDVWTPMPTSSPSPMDSVWSGKLPPAPVSTLVTAHLARYIVGFIFHSKKLEGFSTFTTDKKIFKWMTLYSSSCEKLVLSMHFLAADKMLAVLVWWNIFTLLNSKKYLFPSDKEKLLWFLVWPVLVWQWH